MITKKTIIDEQGYIVDLCVDYENGKPKYFEMKNNMKAVDYFTDKEKLIKPKWSNGQWIEGATNEEIQAWEDDNKNGIKNEPSEHEVLLSNILLENAEIKQQLADQQELSATLALQIAEIKGGSANV